MNISGTSSSPSIEINNYNVALSKEDATNKEIATLIQQHPEDEVKFHVEKHPKRTPGTVARLLSDKETLLKTLFNKKLCPICKPKIDETIPNLMTKMLKNQRKAIEEHLTSFGFWDRLGIKLKIRRNVYATITEGLPSAEDLEKYNASKPLMLLDSEDSFTLEEPEEHHTTLDSPTWMFAGIFSGFSSKPRTCSNISYVANSIAKDYWETSLILCKGNIHLALTALIHKIHADINNDYAYKEAGVFAVLSYVDKIDHKIYTATIGHLSEATIYRTINKQFKAIPLSCVRHWASKKDAIRAAEYYKNPSIATEWPNRDPQKLYLGPPNGMKFRASRILGKKYSTGADEPSGLIHKPKITVNKLLPGDLVILSSPGIRERISDRTIANELYKHRKSCVQREGCGDAIDDCIFGRFITCKSPAEHISKYATNNRIWCEHKIISIEVS